MIRTGKVLGYAVGDYNITQEMENRLESLDIDNVTLEDFEAYLIHHEVEIMAMVHPDEKAQRMVYEILQSIYEHGLPPKLEDYAFAGVVAGVVATICAVSAFAEAKDDLAFSSAPMAETT